MSEKSDRVKKSNAEKPISLKPLKFDDAVSALLKAKPEPKESKNKNSIHSKLS